MQKPLGSSSVDQVDVRGLLNVLRERIWLILLCVAVTSAITTAYLYRAPLVFAAKVVLKVEEEDKKVINIQQVQEENLHTQEALKTVEQLLKNRALLGRVLDASNLTNNPRLTGTMVSREGLINHLAEIVDVRLRRGTRLIDITVEHTDAALTEQLANGIVREFMNQNAEQRLQVLQTANQFLADEAHQLRAKLQLSEDALQNYRQKAFSVSLEDRQNIVVQKLKDLTQKGTEAKGARIAQETGYKQMLLCSNDVQALLGIPMIANDPAVMEIRSSMLKAEGEFANLRQEYKAKHPKYIQAQTRLAGLNQALERAVLNVQLNARAGYENAVSTEHALKIAVTEQEALALELNQRAIQHNVLLRDVEANRALYQSVVNRMNETDLTQDLETERIRVVQPATVPEKAVKPKKVRIALVGLLVGVGGGVLLALMLNALDTSVNTVDQAEEYLKLPVLSAIPRFTAGQSSAPLVESNVLKSAEAESFRTLRTALSMLGKKEDRRTFLFTSALPAEGKTLCALNYAASLAQQGLRTLVIDGDLRCPMVERRLNPTSKGSKGVTDLLVGTEEFQAVVQESDQDNLYYIAAGTSAPNPAELLAATGIDALVETALGQFDRVIVDSAPVHAVSDTLLMLGKIQSVCLVVRAHKTPKKIVLRAIQLLKQADGRIAGLVLNRLARNRSYGYYYGSYYEYSYQSRYGKKNTAEAVA